MNLRNILSKAKIVITAVITIAQTSTPSVDNAVNVVQAISPALMSMITIIVVIALPILVFKVLAKSVIDTIRG